MTRIRVSAERLALIVIIALTLAPTRAVADGFDDARAVYDRGDFGTARQMFEPLAQAGNAKAETMMANIYCYARGLPQDWAKAGEWYRKAADQGEPFAQFAMYFVLQKAALEKWRPGVKVVEDPAGLEYLRKAAVQGHPSAEAALSFILSSGPHENAVEGFMWLRKAADFDSFLLHLKLSKAYEQGIGTPVDNAEAYFWALVAKAGAPKLNDPLFSKFFEEPNDSLRAKLSPSQIKDLESRAAAWQPKPAPNFGTDPFIPTETHSISDTLLPGVRGPKIPLGGGTNK